MSASAQPPTCLSVSEFLSWDAPPGERWQLVDGEPVAMAPTSRTHGTIQSELAWLLTSHFRAKSSPCVAVTEPGIVPRALSANNFRITDIAVTCTGYDVEEQDLADPVLIIELLSTSNRAQTWINVWAYTSIPSVREILVVRTTEIGADLLRRDADSNWPPKPATITDGDLTLESVGLTLPFADLYRSTRLARSA